uniref:Secreted protein n=1 Tax=Plectus sambesii TaxID=2011161 RepID=A0A914W3B9_9BILA
MSLPFIFCFVRVDRAVGLSADATSVVARQVQSKNYGGSVYSLPIGQSSPPFNCFSWGGNDRRTSADVVLYDFFVFDQPYQRRLASSRSAATAATCSTYGI